MCFVRTVGSSGHSLRLLFYGLVSFCVIGTPRQASEELIDFGIYRAADDGIADEDDVNVDDNDK